MSDSLSDIALFPSRTSDLIHNIASEHKVNSDFQRRNDIFSFIKDHNDFTRGRNVFLKETANFSEGFPL